jgi:hypothetical protein
MTLPVSPNSISLSQVNIELGLTSNTAISLNNTAVRALFGRTSGTISMSDGWGKSSVVKLGTPTFTAATGGAGTVSFTWNAITSATSYDVTFNGTTTNQTSTTFARTSGVNAGSYALSVVAKATGFTSSDAGVSTTVNVTSPKLATPLYSVVAGGVNSVSFAWTAVSNATSYDVTFNGNTTNQTGLTFNIASGVAAGTYSLSVVAKAANYTNSDAATSGNIIVTNAKLSTPSFTAATGSVNQVSFTWSAVTNATSYDVTFNSVTTTQTSTTFTSVNTLTPGTYYLFVKAKAANYPDSDVGTSSAVATAAVPAPSAPTFSFSNVSSSGFRITLSATNALNYYLYTYPDYLSIGNNTTGVFDISGKSPSTTYQYVAFTQSSDGTTSSWSSVASQATSAAAIVPSTPTYNISLLTANNYRITLSSTNANYYYLYETTGGGFEYIGYTPDGIFNISGKAPSTTQTYQAYATNGTNSGNVNFSVTTSAAPVLPGTVTLTTSNITSTTARITATTNSGSAPTNFHLFRNINGTNTFIRSAVNGIFDLYDMTPGTTYGPYRSYAENAVGISAYWSNDVYVTNTAAATFTPVSTVGNVATAGGSWSYSWTAPTSGLRTFKSENPSTSVDTVMEIYKNGFLEVSNDDSSGNAVNLGSYIQYTVVAGQMYEIRVHLYGATSTGTFNFTIT